MKVHRQDLPNVGYTLHKAKLKPSAELYHGQNLLGE